MAASAAPLARSWRLVTVGKQGARRATARSLRYRICRWEPGQVRGQAGPQNSGLAGWAGRPGVSATRGREAGGPRARVGGPAWSRRRAAARGKGGVCEQPGQQQGLGSGTPGALGRGIHYHGGFAPRLLQTEGNCVLGGEERPSAGWEGADLLGPQAHLWGDGPDPCPKPWTSSSLTALAGFGDPSSSQP